MPKQKSKIPKSAKRVFKGVIFDVWQWKQKMFDGSYATFEKLKRTGTVNIIATSGDKIILLSQKQPDWKNFKNTLVGGRIDEGELPLQAAKRELLEETGHASKNWKLWQEINPHHKIIWTVYNFVARDCKKMKESHLDAGEKIFMRFATFDEFLKLADDPDFYEGELKSFLIRAKYDKKYKQELKILFFGKK